MADLRHLINISALPPSVAYAIQLVGVFLVIPIFVLVVVYFVASYVREYAWGLYVRRVMGKQGIRGPPPKFRVGNLVERNEMRKAATEKDMETLSHDIVPRLMPDYVHWSKIYGKRFMFWWGSEPRLVLHDMDEIRDVLSSKHVYSFGRSRLQREGVKDFIGTGLLMAHGEAWAHQRRVVAPAFHVDKLKGFVIDMVECTSRMLQQWDEKLQQFGRASATDNTKVEIEIEMSQQMSQLTADIIARTQFGSSYEDGKAMFEKLQELQKLSSQSSKHGLFTPRALRSRVKQLKVEMERSLMSLIIARKESMEKNFDGSHGYDLLGVMLSEIEAARRERKQFKYSLQQLKDECKTFFFTGHDTTALLLTWTLMLLASNLHWQERAREEILRITKGDPPNSNMLSSMKVVGMILLESLRLYTPATLLAREAIKKNVKVGKNKLYIPCGVSVWVPVLAMHHDTTIWGPSAHEFKPERFASDHGLGDAGPFPPTSVSSLLMPFSCGPRNCVGQNFALMEAKVVLTMILSRFRLHLSPSYCHAPVFFLTLKPKHGLPILLEHIT